MLGQLVGIQAFASSFLLKKPSSPFFQFSYTLFLHFSDCSSSYFRILFRTSDLLGSFLYQISPPIIDVFIPVHDPVSNNSQNSFGIFSFKIQLKAPHVFKYWPCCFLISRKESITLTESEASPETFCTRHSLSKTICLYKQNRPANVKQRSK